jgi:hypothetical protein
MVFFKHQQSSGLTPELELQAKVARILGLGFVFSILPVCEVGPMTGVAPVIAVILGLRARSLLKKSTIPLDGVEWMRWCIIVGILASPAVVSLIVTIVKGLRFARF